MTKIQRNNFFHRYKNLTIILINFDIIDFNEYILNNKLIYFKFDNIRDLFGIYIIEY